VGNEITDEGVEALAVNAYKFENLERLWLG
jgi:hypothetical protein